MDPLSQPRKDIDRQSRNPADSAERLRQNFSGNSSVLNSWKEIARYLGRGVRTVQRWERHLDLPVRRAQGKYHSSVLAFPEELDDWLHRMPAGCNGGNGVGSNGESELAPVLLELARGLLEEAERLVNFNGRHRPEAGNSLRAIREIVQELASFTDKVRSSPPALTSGANGAKRILSIDDEPALLVTREQVLRSQGYEVLSAPDGEKALRLFAEHAIDLVLLDYSMPGMNGGVVARKMKEHKPLVPVIIVSGNRVPQEALSCAECLIAKGDGPAVLLQRIRELLASNRHDRWSQLS